MRVIAVLDLMDRVIVRGIGGRRDRYRPIDSPLVEGAAPQAVARAIRQRFGIAEFYLADLDAIEGRPPSWDIYDRLLGEGVALWVDAGLRDRRQAAAMAAFEMQSQELPVGSTPTQFRSAAADRRPDGVIAGLETVGNPQTLAAMIEEVGQDRLVFSLDLLGGAPLASRGWPASGAWDIAQHAFRAGVRRFIVLDLARVGMGQGTGTGELCRRLRGLDNSIEIVAGGGVRGVEDLGSLADAGCNAALVASALHDGRLTPEGVRSLGPR